MSPLLGSMPVLIHSSRQRPGTPHMTLTTRSPAIVVPKRVPAVCPDNAAAPSTIEVGWARHLDEVREAQRLRYAVFCKEMGARLTTPLPRHDIDRFDDFCEHVIARDLVSGLVVGTYRLLTPTQARRAGGSYMDGEFDLSNLAPLRSQAVELGRSCVHPKHRTGTAILAMWQALAQFMVRNELTIMIGCASVPMASAGRLGVDVAASICARLIEQHPPTARWRVTPRVALPMHRLDGDARFEAPGLIQAYLRLGTGILGEPAWDPDFQTADLPMLMDLANLPERYRRRLLRA